MDLQPGSEVIKLFSCSAELKFKLLINTKLAKNLGNCSHLPCSLKLYRKMENFRVVQFSRNFTVGRDPQKLKSVKNIPSLSKVKAIFHKRSKIRFCSSHFLYINQTKTQV